MQELVYQKHSFSVLSIYALSSWIEVHSSTLKKRNIPFFEIEEPMLKKISNLKTSNEGLAILKMPKWPSLKAVLEVQMHKGITLVLDNLQDPGNFGTIIRIADWFGISTIIASKGSVDVFNTKVIQASMGKLLKSTRLL